jgi:transaldolase / glucose-6-phosphate isomerase
MTNHLLDDDDGCGQGKHKLAFPEKLNAQQCNLGGYAQTVEARLHGWERADVVRRIWQKDPTVWLSGAVATYHVADLTDRLGWLTIVQPMRADVGSMEDFAAAIREEGFTQVVLLGMGGSSMAPEVFMAIFGAAPGYPPLTVLDSTHPAAAQRVLAGIDVATTLFVVSSKSGGTIETLSFFKFFYDALGRVKKQPGENFIVITDPGSKLETLAMDKNFRLVFSSPPEVGGRYSALTYFGLVPAALIGVSLPKLMEHALAMAEACSCDIPATQNPAVILGAVMGELTLAGRDKMTLLTSPSLVPFGVWVEQLIAESTGKHGTGIVPVVGEALAPPDQYGKDRWFVLLRLDGDANQALDAGVEKLEAAGFPVVHIGLQGKEALGQEFFRWEMATAAAGAVLAINPFDQPNVEAAKVKARELMAAYQKTGSLPGDTPVLEEEGLEVYGRLRGKAGTLRDSLADFLNQAQSGDYLALMAYIPASAASDASLNQIRLTLRDRLKIATTVGYGPRFLHSTGQLHKGDANKGLFLQITHSPEVDVPIPGESYTFGILIAAQALGDCQALLESGRRVLRIHLRGDVLTGLQQLQRALI